MVSSVLLDTSFFIRLMDDTDPLHKNAKNYYKYFLDNGVILKMSTISVAEYCTRGTIDELPLKNLQLIPFNFNHAIKAGEFSRILFDYSKQSGDKIQPRVIIPNDAKLLAQAESESSITHYLTSDTRSSKLFSILKNRFQLHFDFIDIQTPYNQVFSLLDFTDEYSLNE